MIRESLPELPVTRPADWGFNVSCCFALMCDSRKHIIMVSDQLAAFGDFSAENAVLKNWPLGRRGAVLFAGNDADEVPIVHNAASKQIKKLKADYDPDVIAEILDECYHERLDYLIEKRVLRRYKLTAKTFVNSGKRKLSESRYQWLCEKIDKVNLSLRFLMCGFNKFGTASIFSGGGGDKGGEGVRDHSELGFWAIGQGASSAISSLAFRIHRKELSVHHDIEQACYMALEAKFMAESARDVGRSTFFAILGAEPTDTRFIKNADIVKIRSQWERKGARRIVPSIIETIKNNYYQPPDMKEMMEETTKLLAAQKSEDQR